MASGKRNTNEDFQAYRERLKAQAATDKLRKHDRVVWDSRRLGTYVKN